MHNYEKGNFKEYLQFNSIDPYMELYGKPEYDPYSKKDVSLSLSNILDNLHSIRYIKRNTIVQFINRDITPYNHTFKNRPLDELHIFEDYFAFGTDINNLESEIYYHKDWILFEENYISKILRDNKINEILE